MTIKVGDVVAWGDLPSGAIAYDKQNDVVLRSGVWMEWTDVPSYTVARHKDTRGGEVRRAPLVDVVWDRSCHCADVRRRVARGYVAGRRRLRTRLDLDGVCARRHARRDPAADRAGRVRKERHLAKLAALTVPPMNELAEQAAIVIACDKLHNLRTQLADLAAGSETVVFNAPLAERTWLHRETCKLLGRGALPARLAVDLARATADWTGATSASAG